MGLMSATDRAAYYGFTGHGAVTTTFHPETGFKDVNVYVELVAPREKLEAFLAIRRRWWLIASFCTMRSNTGIPPTARRFRDGRRGRVANAVAGAAGTGHNDPWRWSSP